MVSLRKAILITGAGGFRERADEELLKNDDYSVIAVTSQRDSLLI